MYWSFQRKLATIICLITLGICLATYLAVRTSFTEGFFAYLTASRHNDATLLANAIQQSVNSQQQWENFTRSPRNFHDLYRQITQSDKLSPGPRQQTEKRQTPNHNTNKQPPDYEAKGRKPKNPPRQRFAPPSEKPFTLIDSNHLPYFIHDRYERDWDTVPIVLQSKSLQDKNTDKHGKQETILAYIAIAPIRDNTPVADKLFIESQNRWFRIIAVLSAVLFTLLAWPATALLMRPLRDLSRAVEQLAKRDYEVRVELNSDDDFGKLAKEFNSMAQQLGEFDQRQRNWIADISHELRTPLAIMQAEIEAVQDGVREANPAFIESLKSETLQLRQLVDDLHAIVLSESGGVYIHREWIDLHHLIEQQIEFHQQALQAKNMSFTLNDERISTAATTEPLPSERAQQNPLLLMLDRNKINQVIVNLIQNSIRYTDDNGIISCVIRQCKHASDTTEIIWQDSSPGVDSEHLSKLFDRLYRVEASRNRAAGGSGLGLSVCKAIIENHQGSISASGSSLGGLKVTICLPIH